jgi:hypothetical protein
MVYQTNTTDCSLPFAQVAYFALGEFPVSVLQHLLSLHLAPDSPEGCPASSCCFCPQALAGGVVGLTTWA